MNLLCSSKFTSVKFHHLTVITVEELKKTNSPVTVALQKIRFVQEA